MFALCFSSRKKSHAALDFLKTCSVIRKPIVGTRKEKRVCTRASGARPLSQLHGDRFPVIKNICGKTRVECRAYYTDEAATHSNTGMVLP